VGYRLQKKIQAGTALRGRKPDFTFTASPLDLCVLPSGEIVPYLGVITHEKGFCGAKSTGPKPDDVDEDGAIVNAMKSPGRIVIPHDIVVLAWGKERKGYSGDADNQPLSGSEGEWWNDAWTRITWEDGQPSTEVDAAGYLDFHRRVLAIICPRGLTKNQIQAAEKRSGLVAGPDGKARQTPVSP